MIAEHHVVVVPTRWETFSYVVREALACNRPVIATPAGGIIDVVRQGESGWLAESAATDELAATLREVLEGRDGLMEMIAEGLPRAAFDRDAQEARVLQAYLEVLERRGERHGWNRGAGSEHHRARGVRGRRRRPLPDIGLPRGSERPNGADRARGGSFGRLSRARSRACARPCARGHDGRWLGRAGGLGRRARAHLRRARAADAGRGGARARLPAASRCHPRQRARPRLGDCIRRQRRHAGARSSRELPASARRDGREPLGRPSCEGRRWNRRLETRTPSATATQTSSCSWSAPARTAWCSRSRSWRAFRAGRRSACSVSTERSAAGSGGGEGEAGTTALGCRRAGLVACPRRGSAAPAAPPANIAS